MIDAATSTVRKPILELRGIGKTFNGVPALQDVSLEFEEGTIVALVGENGAGKSTLMKILSGGYGASQYTGEILMDGIPRRFRSPLDARQCGIAMIYQDFGLHPDLSLAENIFLGRLPTRAAGIVDWPRAHQEADRQLRRVGLNLPSQTIARSVSTSVLQLVAIAKALSANPRVLILDEPTSALTEGEIERLLALLVTLKERGVLCLYISHKMEEVMAIADRIAVLRDGRMIQAYAKAGSSREQIVEDMVGRPVTTLYPKTEHPPGEEILRVEGLTVPHPCRRNKNLVTAVSFSLRRGEVLGLAGLVGAGRSELLRAIFGAEPATGRVVVQGRPLSIASPRDALQAGIVLLTEDRKIDGYVCTMDIANNISLASLAAISRGGLLDFGQEDQTAARYVRDLSVRAPGIHANIRSLSGGNQQKVVLAKWMWRTPAVLLLDDPTRGIDVGAKAQIYRLIMQLAAQGAGIVMTSSELPELLGLCDRFLVLANGVVADEFSRAEASPARVMRAATGSSVRSSRNNPQQPRGEECKSCKE